MKKLIRKVLQINTLYEHFNKIIYIDDVNKFVIRQRRFGTTENLNIYIEDQTEDFPHSHHIH